jgi:hypothetical protein
MGWKMSYHVSRLVPPSAGSTRYLVGDGLGMAQAGRMAGGGLQELPFSWAGEVVVTSARVSVDPSSLHGLPVCQWYDSPLKMTVNQRCALTGCTPVGWVEARVDGG